MNLSLPEFKIYNGIPRRDKAGSLFVDFKAGARTDINELFQCMYVYTSIGLYVRGYLPLRVRERVVTLGQMYITEPMQLSLSSFNRL
jgi:hypothetical protein